MTVTLRSTAGPLSMTFYTISRCVTTLVVYVYLTLALTSSFYADDSSSSSDVMTLTTNNFDVAVAEAEHLFVQFCE